MKTQQSLIDLKADNSEMLKFVNDKADKNEILQLIPNVDIKATVEQYIKEDTGFILKSINEMQWAWENKIIKLRNDIDIFQIKKEIHSKLDSEDFRDTSGKLEENI